MESKNNYIYQFKNINIVIFIPHALSRWSHKNKLKKKQNCKSNLYRLYGYYILL